LWLWTEYLGLARGQVVEYLHLFPLLDEASRNGASGVEPVLALAFASFPFTVTNKPQYSFSSRSFSTDF